MLRMLPKWVGEADKRIRELVDNIIREQYIDWHLSHDSKSLDNAINSITNILEGISEYSHPMHVTKKEAELFLKSTNKKMGRPTKITKAIGDFILRKPKESSRTVAKMVYEEFGIPIQHNAVCYFRNKQKVAKK